MVLDDKTLAALKMLDFTAFLFYIYADVLYI